MARILRSVWHSKLIISKIKNILKKKKIVCIFKKDVITYKELEHFVSSVNSYLGFMVHYNSFNIRKKILSHNNMIGFYKFGCVNTRHSKIKIKHRRNEYVIKTS